MSIKEKIYRIFRLFQRLVAKIVPRIKAFKCKISSATQSIIQLIVNQLKFRSVKFEISVIYTLILGIILISFSSIFYIIVSRTLYKDLDNELNIKAKGVAESVHDYLKVRGEEPNALEYAVRQTVTQEDRTLRRWWYIGFERNWYRKLDEQDLSQDYVNFISLSDSFYVKSHNFNDKLFKMFLTNLRLEKNERVFWDMDFQNNAIRVINYPFFQNDNVTHVIQVGISKGPIILLLQQWMTSVFISIPIILFLTGYIGRWLTARILRPVDRIVDAASKISYENLNLRVLPKLHYKEMDQVIGTFNDMLSRLEKSFHHIDEFSTHVAHELKTPLTIIRGEAELLHFSAKEAEQKEATKTIIDEIDKVLKTIEDLLYIGRMQHHVDTFNFSDLLVNNFLIDLVEQFKYITKNKKIELTLKMSDAHIFVRADELHLRRLFFNLLDNAVKFTPTGGKIMLSLSSSSKYATIRVIDTGPGIAKENIECVFDQFFQEGHCQSGTGLGLSIAQGIVKAHHGTITVESELNQGSTFVVSLPSIKKSS